MPVPHVHANNVPKVNDVVLIKEKMPRGAWKLAIIKTLISSRDGLYRAAEVQLPNIQVKPLLNVPLIS